MTRNLKIISDSRIRYIVSKGPKYRVPSRIDLKTCREEIASALNASTPTTVFRRTWADTEELLKEKSFFILSFVFLSEFVIRQVQTNIY